MKVTRRQEEVLTNHEVLSLLRESRQQRQSELRVRNHRLAGKVALGDAENLKIVESQVLSYLENSAAAEQTPEAIEKLKANLEPYDLCPAEIQMIINLRPGQPAQLMPIIEECLNRFSQEDLADIAAAVQASLPEPPPLDSYDAEEEEEQDENPVDFTAEVEPEKDVKGGIENSDDEPMDELVQANPYERKTANEDSDQEFNPS